MDGSDNSQMNPRLVQHSYTSTLSLCSAPQLHAWTFVFSFRFFSSYWHFYSLWINKRRNVFYEPDDLILKTDSVEIKIFSQKISVFSFSKQCVEAVNILSINNAAALTSSSEISLALYYIDAGTQLLAVTKTLISFDLLTVLNLTLIYRLLQLQAAFCSSIVLQLALFIPIKK